MPKRPMNSKKIQQNSPKLMHRSLMFCIAGVFYSIYLNDIVKRLSNVTEIRMQMECIIFFNGYFYITLFVFNQFYELNKPNLITVIKNACNAYFIQQQSWLSHKKKSAKWAEI